LKINVAIFCVACWLGAVLKIGPKTTFYNSPGNRLP
jgi:hypothetical protein